jgi:hypothetical protein
MLLLVHADGFLEGRLIYVSSDLSFDTLDRQTPGASSILINVSFPRNFVFQEMGYKAPGNWKEKRS